MPAKTLSILGPGGVGKSPLDKLVQEDVVRIEPYRLRPGGPRDENDILYGHPKLREQLHQVFHGLGLSPRYPTPGIEWFPQAMTLFLKVRSEWQLLFLPQQGSELAKAEIYAPRLIELLDIPLIRQAFGRLQIIILNPSHLLIGDEPGSAREEAELLEDLTKRTMENCLLRGDAPEQAGKGAQSVGEELPAWREAIRIGGKEFREWPFPEHRYSRQDADLVLAQARAELVGRWPELASFLRSVP